MCGIFGFLGSQNCFRYGINGLRQLQNRGYDSAGCATVNNELIIRKFASTATTDSIDALENVEADFDGCFNGVFHTRWATHGAKTDYNAHPHVDNFGRIALVHNGIIENYYELKLELESQNINFYSETDTEVIVNLISIYYDQIKHLKTAIMKAVSRLRGTWALVVICKDKPNNIYCARHGSPLLIGFNDNLNDNSSPYVIVTSEQAGFCKYVDRYLCLNNGDITVIKKRDKITFSNIENYIMRDITIKNNELTPDPFPHWTLKEIHEQYESSIRAISFGGRIVENDKVRLGGPAVHETLLASVEHLILLGCGTSLNACQHATYFFKDLCNFTTVQAFDGSEFIADDIPKRGRSCAILLSQSGETKDLYRCIKICKENTIFTIGVINVVDSLIAREVDCGCYLNAGREVGVASTKAFTSQVILLSMLAVFFAQINDLNQSKRKHYIKSLKQLSSDIKQCIQDSESVCKDIASYLVTQKSMFVLGKGSMLSVASEGSLKTKEIGYIHSEAYGGNSLRHGPYAVVEDGTPIIFINPSDFNFAMMNNTIEEVKSRNAYPIVVSDTTDISRHALKKVIVPFNEIYKGVLHNIPMQLIAYYMAILKEHNPDMPKNLSKCVSV